MRLSIFHLTILIIASSITAAPDVKTSSPRLLEKAEGYNGIWYQNQPQADEYKYKYSGGFATYPQQHIPIAIYRPQVDKTFFVYGGTDPGKQELLHMVAYYDHKTKEVSRPHLLLNKKTGDAHDNPVISIDDEGYIFIFSPSHGGARPTYIHKSTKPYSIAEFVALSSFNYSYPQPKYVPGKGFLFLYTVYTRGRALHMSTSDDGTTWTEKKLLALAGQGHYQISNQKADGTVATAFNYHPAKGGLNARTNVNYMETSDMGKTWTTADGVPIQTPVSTSDSLALVHDYAAENLLVYLKDIAFDQAGNPIILYLTTKGFESGPKNDPRTWYTAYWDGDSWTSNPVTISRHNYDYGSIYVEDDGSWRIVAPVISGPQRYNPGGEVAILASRDKGFTWERVKQLTRNSKFNHTYVRRPVDAHPEFYALWADGDARNPSESSLYFTDRDGTAVWRLPQRMNSDMARPEAMALPSNEDTTVKR